MNTIKRISAAFLLPLALCSFSACDPAPEPTDDKAASKDSASPEAESEPVEEDIGDEIAEALDPRVERASKLARLIEADPHNADSILEGEGLDREALNDLMYEIARDPSLSESYQAQRAAG